MFIFENVEVESLLNHSNSRVGTLLPTQIASTLLFSFHPSLSVAELRCHLSGRAAVLALHLPSDGSHAGHWGIAGDVVRGTDIIRCVRRALPSCEATAQRKLARG